MTDWLAEIESRCEAATRGPWREGTFNVWQDDLLMVVASTERHTYEGGRYVPLQRCSDTLAQEQADAEFIAHARQDIPQLLAIARQVAELKEAFTKMMPEFCVRLSIPPICADCGQPITDTVNLLIYGEQDFYGPYCDACNENRPRVQSKRKARSGR